MEGVYRLRNIVEKTEKVIESCETEAQLEIAKVYVRRVQKILHFSDCPVGIYIDWDFRMAELMGEQSARIKQGLQLKLF